MPHARGRPAPHMALSLSSRKLLAREGCQAAVHLGVARQNMRPMAISELILRSNARAPAQLLVSRRATTRDEVGHTVHACRASEGGWQRAGMCWHAMGTFGVSVSSATGTSCPFVRVGLIQARSSVAL